MVCCKRTTRPTAYVGRSYRFGGFVPVCNVHHLRNSDVIVVCCAFAIFPRAIAYLNQFLDEDKRISHIMWDMHRTAKSRDGNVLRTLNEIGVRGMTQVGFFHAGPDLHCNRLRTPNTTVGGVPYGAGFPGA